MKKVNAKNTQKTGARSNKNEDIFLPYLVEVTAHVTRRSTPHEGGIFILRA